MPPTLALCLTVAFICFLFKTDLREKPNVTQAIWLPTLWIFIIASQPVSTWLGVFGLPAFGAATMEDGSSVDAFIFFGLIASGSYVLAKRQIRFSEVMQNNRWLVIFLLYCLAAVVWSDYSFTSLKRWIKILGHPLMILILFTEPDPRAALTTVMKRCGYVLFPVSILWMKYYPNLGRKFDEWGDMTNAGISGNKNQLGAICLLFGLFLLWDLLQVRRQKNWVRSGRFRSTAVLLLLIGYCLHKAHSSTSTLCVLLGALTMWILGRRLVDKRLIGTYAIGLILAITLAQVAFDLYGSIVDLTGHGATIEGRGRLWQTLLETNSDPILGTGFESYWLGQRVENIWTLPEFVWRPTQAHNGYLETYLNLGAVGVCMLLGLILVAFRKSRNDLLNDFEWGRFTMSLLIAILAHNWTEAGFKGLSIVYFFFFMVTLKFPHLNMSPRESIAAAPVIDELELAYGGVRAQGIRPHALPITVTG